MLKAYLNADHNIEICLDPSTDLRMLIYRDGEVFFSKKDEVVGECTFEDLEHLSRILPRLSGDLEINVGD